MSALMATAIVSFSMIRSSMENKKKIQGHLSSSLDCEKKRKKKNHDNNFMSAVDSTYDCWLRT